MPKAIGSWYIRFYRAFYGFTNMGMMSVCHLGCLFDLVLEIINLSDYHKTFDLLK